MLPHLGRSTIKTVVLIGASGFFEASCKSRSQLIVLILAQPDPGGQHSRVVPPAREMQAFPVGQQKLSGKSGHFAYFAGHVKACREKSWLAGIAVVEAIVNSAAR